MTAVELAAEAKSCLAAGATAMHVHVRDRDGKHTLDTEVCKQTLTAIRAAVGDSMVIQITTEACGIYSAFEQMNMVREVRPEAASVALREFVPQDSDVPEAARFFSWARARGIGLQYVVYDDADVSKAVQLQCKGVIPDEQPHLLCVVGRYKSSRRSSVADLLPFLAVMPSHWPWSVCAFGGTESRCIDVAIGCGGNVRIGFESDVPMPDGGRAGDNAALVSNTRSAIERFGRRVGTVGDARALFLG